HGEAQLVRWREGEVPSDPAILGALGGEDSGVLVVVARHVVGELLAPATHGGRVALDRAVAGPAPARGAGGVDEVLAAPVAQIEAVHELTVPAIDPQVRGVVGVAPMDVVVDAAGEVGGPGGAAGLPVLGEDLDHTAGGLGAVERGGCRPLDDLDVVDVGGVDVLQRVRGGAPTPPVARRLVDDPDAVHV